MIRPALFVLLLAPAVASAVICKTVDSDGVVGYTDVPVAECAQPLKLPEYSRYAPRPIEQAAPNNATASGSVQRFERYQSMNIVQPQGGATVRSNDGSVGVVIALQPELQTGHRVALYLDGSALSDTFDGLSIQLSNVNRGTHSLRARVLDPSGRALIESPAVRFTLRKLGLNDPGNNPPPPPPPKPKPGYPAPTTPPDYSLPNPDYSAPGDPDYSPPAAPDYTPKTAPITVTPGKTNPTFAPKYTP